MADLLSVDEALRAVLARPSRSRQSASPRCRGRRVLARPALAVVDLPPFASSAMDGFACGAADTPGRLPGRRSDRRGPARRASLAQGEAMGIATGGVVPEGADAVVPIERVEVWTTRSSSRRLRSPAATFVRQAATCLQATSSSRQARGSGRADRRARGGGCRRGRVRAPAQRRRAHHRHRVAPRRATRSRPARSTSRTASCCRRCSAKRAQIVERSARSQTTSPRTAPRSSTASRTTCSSPRAASRSGRTTSCAGSRPRSAWRRSSGACP